MAAPATLTEVVLAYRQNYRPGARPELEYYANLPSLEEAVARASRAERPDGKRHDHQTRIHQNALHQVERRLAKTSLRSYTSFATLHSFLDRRIGSVPGVGELMVYDTALRIGAKLGFEPEVVYLHRGTRSGMRALGLNIGRAFIELHELPRPLRSLRPHEIEDCVCIYKSALGALASAQIG
jgi:hypothetical protein